MNKERIAFAIGILLYTIILSIAARYAWKDDEKQEDQEKK